MEQITLQRVTTDDWKTVFQIETSAASDFYFSIDNEKEILEYIESHIVYFIIKDDEAIGTIAYKIEADEKVQLDGLIIVPEYRGKGIAKEAIHKVITEVGNKVYFLTVHPSNSVAIRLYLGLGFVIKAWKDNYFGDNQPRLIMEKVN